MTGTKPAHERQIGTDRLFARYDETRLTASLALFRRFISGQWPRVSPKRISRNSRYAADRASTKAFKVE
jgi:hypothetical protein